jgi:acyl-[acyl carrier protein]--UDP-N-acetylglucosamine O-acyltransferase
MKFDFGYGKVEAARHKNPNGSEGGWVAATAKVEKTARVFGNARVSGNAWVSGNAQVSGDAQVFGNARVSGNAWVSGNARVFGNAQVSGNARVSGDAWKFTPLHIIHAGLSLTVCAYGTVRIGCEVHTLAEWKKNAQQIAKNHNIQKDAAADYKDLLATAERWMKRHGVDKPPKPPKPAQEAGKDAQ